MNAGDESEGAARELIDGEENIMEDTRKHGKGGPHEPCYISSRMPYIVI